MSSEFHGFAREELLISYERIKMMIWNVDYELKRFEQAFKTLRIGMTDAYNLWVSRGEELLRTFTGNHYLN